MNCRTLVPSAVVLICLSTSLYAGESRSPLAPGPADVAGEPNAADLVRDARASEEWLHRIDTLYLRTESTWRHPPESIAAYSAARKREDPNWEPDPQYNDHLWPSYEDRLEYAIDFESKRLRYVADTPRREYLLRVWDAGQCTQYVRRADGYEQYSLESTMDKFEWLLGGMSWPQTRLHVFWWDARDTERLRDYFGHEEDFRLAGQLDYRGVRCHVLERVLRTDPAWVYRWYVGASDHLLRGRREYREGQCRFEHWTLDYHEVAAGCRIPMTQGYSAMVYDPDKRVYRLGLCRDVKIVEARVNKKLSNELFHVEIVEGAPVFDTRSGELLVYDYVAIPRPLAGLSVPEMTSLGFDSAAQQTEGKGILLCFADLDQRPSRRCVTDLAAGYERLRSLGIVLSAVDVSGMDKESLTRWKQEQKIPFRIGKADGDLKAIRRTWGIRSLPWLILTDPDHVVIGEGFATSDLDARIGANREARDAAEGPKRTVVTVTDKEGNVLAGVRVTEVTTAGQYTTDTSGQFVCEASDQVRYFYAVDSQRRLAEGERLEPGCEQLSMRLAPARVVSGRVTDPNGRPVAGVQIAALPMTSSYVLTNGQGEFDVGWPAEWEPGSGLCLMARHVERNLAAIVDISRQAARVDIQLVPALSLSGTVAAADGTSISGATVSLVLRRWRWGCGTPVERAPVDAAGHFTIPTLPQLQEYELHARAPGYATEELRTGVISVVKDREDVGAIQLTRAGATAVSNEMGRLGVRIVDEDLRPVDVAAAQIWKKGEEGGAHAEDVLLISGSMPGLYEIDSLAVGKYHALSINAEGFAPFWLPDVEVQKEPPEIVVCKLSRGGTIEGLVTDEGGRPVMGLPVVINSILCRTDAVTDPNGRFFADHLPDTRYSVIVEPESESPYATTVLNGGASCNARDLRIVVKRKTEERAVTSLVGTSVWQLKGVSVPLEQSKCQGRAILLCLFDGGQRPSRNCVRQLGEKAEDLEARKVIVASIDVSKADSAGREGATLGNRIAAAAHAESLPWLILTDEEHVVRAEGFPLDELEKRIEQICGE